MVVALHELKHSDLVPRLVDAIEARGHAALAARRHRRDGVAELEPATVYAALANELNQSPEAVRQELRKFRLRARLPRARKVILLVDAAVQLRWLDSAATGTGAERLVAWCRSEMARRTADVDAKRRKAAAERLGTMKRRVHELVAKTFDEEGINESHDEVGTVLVVQLAEAIVESALSELCARQRWWEAGSAKRLRDSGSAVRKRLHDEANRVAGAWHRQCVEEAEIHASAREAWLESETASRYLERAAALGQKQLTERALTLGIGRGQLNRILNGLASGAPAALSADDSRRARELLGGLNFQSSHRSKRSL